MSANTLLQWLLFIQREKMLLNEKPPIIVVGDASLCSYNGRENHFLQMEELDDLAQLLSDNGQHVMRYSGSWPRNKFYCSRDKFVGSIEDAVLGDHGLFLCDNELKVFSDYAFISSGLPYMKFCDMANENLGESEEVVFRIWPKKYPSSKIKNCSLKDIDYAANLIPSLKAIVTYDAFIKINQEAIERLDMLGYSKVIRLPDDEFEKFAVCFETFENNGEEFIVADRGCKKTMAILESCGANVLPTLSEFKGLNHIFANGSVGGSVRCATNKVYREQVAELPANFIRDISGMVDIYLQGLAMRNE